MKLLAAYMLATLGGNEAPTAADVKSILASVGVEADAARLTALIASLKGKSVEELIAEGSKKLASMPAAGAAPAAVAAAPAAAGGAAKKAEKAPEPAEESDEDMGFGLFD